MYSIIETSVYTVKHLHLYRNQFLTQYNVKRCIVLQTDSYNLQNITVTKFPKSYYLYLQLLLTFMCHLTIYESIFYTNSNQFY